MQNHFIFWKQLKSDVHQAQNFMENKPPETSLYTGGRATPFGPLRKIRGFYLGKKGGPYVMKKCPLAEHLGKPL